MPHVRKASRCVVSGPRTDENSSGSSCRLVEILVPTWGSQATTDSAADRTRTTTRICLTDQAVLNLTWGGWLLATFRDFGHVPGLWPRSGTLATFRD
eukprot:7049664-Prymnesium_polylepis.1